AVVVAAGVAADPRGAVGAVATRALHPVGAGVLAPGPEGELAAGVAVVQVELADEGFALGVSLGHDHSEFALAAPALLVVGADRRDQVGPGLRGRGERHRGEEGRDEQGGAERWHGGGGLTDGGPFSHRRHPRSRRPVPDRAVCAGTGRSFIVARWPFRIVGTPMPVQCHHLPSFLPGDSPWRSPTRASPASTTRSPTMPATSSTSRPRPSR